MKPDRPTLFSQTKKANFLLLGLVFSSGVSFTPVAWAFPKQQASSQIAQTDRDSAKSPFIGLHYKAGTPGYPNEELPSNIEDMGGWVVGEVSQNPLFIVNRMIINGENSQMLWLQNRTQQSEYLDVLDVLKISLKSDEDLYAGGSCTQNGNQDLNRELVAIVQQEEGVWELKKIRQAWRTNLQTQKFEAIPTQGIVCYYEGE